LVCREGSLERHGCCLNIHERLSCTIWNKFILCCCGVQNQCRRAGSGIGNIFCLIGFSKKKKKERERERRELPAAKNNQVEASRRLLGNGVDGWLVLECVRIRKELLHPIVYTGRKGFI
jgi:hypothetical protein